MPLLGFGPRVTRQEKAPSAPAGKLIFDVSSAQFEQSVLQASMTVPVLADFWAPWCGPCKQLTPVLEAEITAAGGRVLLAKINIDENPDLAQALQIQSVPTVMAFFQGQPVTGFAGARPASEIRNLIAQLVTLAKSAKPGALDLPAALKEAATFLTEQDYEPAQQIYLQILAQDENNADAYAGLIRVLIAVGALTEAQDMAARASEAVQKSAPMLSVKTALGLAAKAGEAASQLAPLEKKLDANPADLQTRFDLAKAQFAGGQQAASIENLLAIIRTDRNWNNEAARKELLQYFEALGFADPLAIDGRKKLSRILFS